MTSLRYWFSTSRVDVNDFYDLSSSSVAEKNDSVKATLPMFFKLKVPTNYCNRST